ncbi:hypothetical protein MASSI9I_70530 [Massilia sp. 9I]|nr:hypothetical protein MASSI9I_70530 [Massilia sp. 9I]
MEQKFKVKNDKTRRGNNRSGLADAQRLAGTVLSPDQAVDAVRLVQLLRQLLAADALVVTLHCGGQLALALCSWLFVKLASAQFGQQTGFFDSALEATHSDFERLVFFKADSGHVKMKPLDLGRTKV